MATRSPAPTPSAASPPRSSPTSAPNSAYEIQVQTPPRRSPRNGRSPNRSTLSSAIATNDSPRPLMIVLAVQRTCQPHPPRRRESPQDRRPALARPENGASLLRPLRFAYAPAVVLPDFRAL